MGLKVVIVSKISVESERLRSKPNLRLLFVGISFLLVNIWINLLWRKISQPRRGGRLIFRDIFNLKQMLEFLRQAVDRIYQVREAIYLTFD